MERLMKTFLLKTSSRPLQSVFKTSSKRLDLEVDLYREISDDEFVENECESEDSVDTDESDEENGNLISPSGMTWHSTVPPVRNLGRNIIRFRSGATANPSDELHAFSLFLNETILRTIPILTNRRLRTRNRANMAHREPICHNSNWCRS